MRKLIAVAGAMALMTSASFAQGSMGGTEKGANKTQNPQLTNCPKDDPSNAQAVEKSAIVPSAEGHKQSAAPTVQREGKTVEADPRCAEDPKQGKK